MFLYILPNHASKCYNRRFNFFLNNIFFLNEDFQLILNQKIAFITLTSIA